MSKEVDDTTDSNKKKPTLNGHYGHKHGIWQSLSLLLNTGLMIYAHVGLSAVILSSRDPSILDIVLESDSTPTTNTIAATNTNSTTITNTNTNTNGTIGLCNATNDLSLWKSYGGEVTRPTQNDFCGREFGCLLNTTCMTECFQTEYGYTSDCSSCFSDIPYCSIMNGCIGSCAADSFSEDCKVCSEPCTEIFLDCSGFRGVPVDDVSVESPTSNYTKDDACHSADLNEIEEWYNVYDLTFGGSVNDAWNGDAKLLAFIIVLFSGVWPYLKNLMLLLIWYVPFPSHVQTNTILWLSRLSKYTLVDVFAVILVLVGVQLQLDVGGTEAVTRAEARGGVLAFFAATLWEFVQIEIVKVMHEKMTKDLEDEEVRWADDEEKESKSRPLWIPSLLLLASIGLFVAGLTTDVVRLTSIEIEPSSFSPSDSAADRCDRTYNLITLANALINDLSTKDNSALWQSWILYLIYVILNMALPILTHILQLILLIDLFKSTDLKNQTSSLKRQKKLSKFTSGIWCFACVEIILIGVFAVEHKFPELVARIAPEAAVDFVAMSSGVGVGFWILLVYSVVAGFTQWILRRTVEETE